ncbi:hypothetical protein JTB14_036839 [Gonioctena quinquepunctata]|nr:hypothetical protein JTB14_036839 [Gonioctena quinquepunctata]
MENAEDNISDKTICFKKRCLGLQSADRKIRKQTYIDLQKYLSTEELTNQEHRNIFSETYMYTLNGLRDKTESVREQAIIFVTFLIIDKLPLNDYYLSYIFPVLVERIGTVELVEESEEVRLQLVQLLDAIVTRYSNTVQLKPFLNDSVIILAEAVKDKFPSIKELCCRTTIKLAEALPRDFHCQAATLIKPVLSCFGHQRYKIRVESINAVGELVMHCDYNGLNEAVRPLAERLFDQIPVVRRTVARVAARWLLDYRDRYSFFYKILPLLLTGLNDEVVETRVEAAELWEKVGSQFQRENEKDFKDELDYLTQLPKYYPANIIRPNLGCRALVKRNVSKLASALSRELLSWQEDIRVRCSQLLCAIALHAEDGITQNLQDLLPAMYSAARDDDPRVVANIVQASELIGCFVKYKVWSDLILPVIEDGPHYGHLTVLCGLVKGAPEEYIGEYVEDISRMLAEDSICCSRKSKYQIEMMKCVKVLCEKHTYGTENSTGYYLFKIIVTTLSLKHPDNEAQLNDSTFDSLKTALNQNDAQDLWTLYTGTLLNHINKNPKVWTTVTDQACIFLTIVGQSNEAFGLNLDVIGDILSEVLDTQCEAEMRLRTFYVLASAFEKKEIIFKKSKDLTKFLEGLIQDIFIPSLVWQPGAAAEAIRTMAASCLQYALIPNQQVELFSADTLRPLVDKLLPLLISLLEDASYRSRQIAVDCCALLKVACCKKGIWNVDDLVTVYPEILKRLDDPTEKVRLCALRNLPVILNAAPEDFRKSNYKAHHELIIDTLMTHFDDDEEEVQKMVYDVLKEVAFINKKVLLHKVERHKPLLRNKKGCDRIIENFESLQIEEVE